MLTRRRIRLPGGALRRGLLREVLRDQCCGHGPYCLPDCSKHHAAATESRHALSRFLGPYEDPPQLLLAALADNLRVNQLALDTARQLFDKQGTDLNSWLMVQQRHRLRSQFLEFSQKLKDEDPVGYRELK